MLRRAAMTLAAVLPAAMARAQGGGTPLALATGARGGAFFDYGPALSRVVAAHAPYVLESRPTAGSNENARLLEAGEVPLALVNMGPAFEAWNGTGPFAARPLRSLRALFPMYETPFAVIALRAAGIAGMRALDGKRVGVGPAGGPAEVFFRGFAEALGIRPAAVVTGAPSDNARQVLAGEIDAFWYGSGLPAAAFAQVADAADAVVFGFAPDEAAAFRARFAYFAPNTMPANTYRGQTAPIATLAVWNFVLANAGLPEAAAHAITRAALEHTAELRALLPAASATAKENAGANTFLPFHPGAGRYYREAGVALAAPVAA